MNNTKITINDIMDTIYKIIQNSMLKLISENKIYGSYKEYATGKKEGFHCMKSINKNTITFQDIFIMNLYWGESNNERNIYYMHEKTYDYILKLKDNEGRPLIIGHNVNKTFDKNKKATITYLDNNYCVPRDYVVDKMMLGNYVKVNNILPFPDEQGFFKSKETPIIFGNMWDTFVVDRSCYETNVLSYNHLILLEIS